MSHEISRHPFRHPLSPEVLEAFTHPRCKVLGRAVRHPVDGAVYAANGCIALRLSRGPAVHDEWPAACPKFLERVDGLPWARLLHDPRLMRQPAWRAFDDVRGLLYRFGLEELWTAAGRMTSDKPVWTADAIMIPLAILQLVARLPKCEARIDGNPDFLCLRFSGGEALIANRYKTRPANEIPPPAFSIFKPRAGGLPGGRV